MYELIAQAGLAGLGSLFGMASGNSAAIRQANAQSKAEGEATVKERLNRTVANSYNTAFGQMQLALKKRQASQQVAGISAAELAASGEASASTAATGSIGASTAAVQSDIAGKADAAYQQVQDSYENAQENYNYELDMMVLNTAQSAPNVRKNTYVGPSTGEMFIGAAFAGLSSFASQYATRSMTLGLGAKPDTPTSKGNSQGSPYSFPSGIRLGGP